jgi:hypothetical protein
MQKNIQVKNKDFAVFILTHGRPDNVITWTTLKKSGYTGKVYLIIDNEDRTAKKYYKKFGKENVIMFDKQAIARTVDNGDNFNDLRTTTHVRNAIFEEAKKMGIKYFIQLDDDYTEFMFRINGQGRYPEGHFILKTQLDNAFDSLLEFYKSIPAKSICMAQGGDFVGGSKGSFADYKLRRKAMNTFICSTDRPFSFISRLNEDVNTYLTLGMRGDLFLTIPILSINQKPTQETEGGMTETYLDNGTYVKSFYSVMYCPSFVKVSQMGRKNKRLHHRVNWKNAVPVILDEKYKRK